MSVQVMTDQEFAPTIGESPKVIVKYYADWCGSCKLFAPKFRRLSEDDRFQGVTFIDVDAENNPEARKMANVDNLPYFATFKDGQLLDGMATAKEEKVVDMLEKLSS